MIHQVIWTALFNHASSEPIKCCLLFPSSNICAIAHTTTTHACVVFSQVLWTLRSRFEVEMIWKWHDVCLARSSYDECVGGCDTSPGAGEGTKKDDLEAKRVSYSYVKQG